jgi:predicted dehydrogenase
MKSFIECVTGGTRPLVTGYDGLAAVKVVVAANVSLKKGVPEEII